MKYTKISFGFLLVCVFLFSLISVGFSAEEPVKGGRLVLATPREVELPYEPPHAGAGGTEIGFPVFEKIAWYQPESGEYEGNVAKSFETDDFKTWTINLREGVKFHDGESVDVEDIEFSINLCAHPDAMSYQMYDIDKIKGYEEYQEGDVDQLSGLKKLDDTTLEITLTEPAPRFQLTLTRVPVYPRHLLKDLPIDDIMDWDFWEDPIGTGPFQFVERESGEFLRFERFSDYWRQEPYLDEIVFRLYKDKGPFLVDLYAGRVHGKPILYPFTLTEGEREEIQEDSNLNYISRPGTTVRGFQFNTDRMDNKRVRKALILALDIPELNEIVGNVDPTRSDFAEPRYRSPEVEEAFQYDPEKALEILQEEGWDFNREVEIITYYETKQFRDLLAAVQAQWESLGIKSSVQHMSPAAYSTFWRDEQNKDILFCGFSQLPGFPSSQQTFYHSEKMYPAGSNITYENPKADELLDKMANAESDEEKIPIAHEFDELSYDEWYWITFYASIADSVINTRVHNFNSWFTSLTMDLKIDQWWMEPESDS